MLNLKHMPPASFLEPEVRMGNIEVTRETKLLWAVQLDLMLELLEVCQKLGLRIYADGGTMLGAVRHKGFIPWDDDIDLVMFRDDYDRLLAEGPSLLDEPYFLQDIKSDLYSKNRHAKLRNSHTACWPKKYGRIKDGGNQGLFIDIFVADYVPNNPREFAKFFKRLRMARMRFSWAYGIVHRLPESWYSWVRNHIPFLSDKHYFEQYEDILRQVPAERSSVTCEFSFRHYAPMFPASLYGDPVMMPFEHVQIPVMQGVHEALRLQYGSNYMTPIQQASSHRPFDFDIEHSYLELKK